MKQSPARVLRGDSWGERLKKVVAAATAGEMTWMAEHTEVLKSDDHSRVGLLRLHDSSCYLKFYQSKSAGQNMLFRFGYARGLRSFDAATCLLEADVLVPAPLCCLLLPGGMMLLTEGIVDGRDLKALWQQNIGEPQRALLMADAGRALAKLHTAGYSHGDCKWSNFLWSADNFYLVDLEGVRQTNRGGKRQARDLARFTVNAEDLGVAPEVYELFLEHYLQGSNNSRAVIIRAMMPFLRQLRRRHEKKYGKRGHEILREH